MVKVINELFELARTELPKINQIELPITVSFRLLQLGKEIDSKSKPYFEAKQKLFEKYGEQTEDGSSLKVRPQFMATFQKELNELMKLEVDIDFEEKIKLPNDMKVSAVFLLALEPFIEVNI